jgi:hypothetical protein
MRVEGYQLVVDEQAVRGGLLWGLWGGLGDQAGEQT